MQSKFSLKNGIIQITTTTTKATFYVQVNRAHSICRCLEMIFKANKVNRRRAMLGSEMCLTWGATPISIRLTV